MPTSVNEQVVDAVTTANVKVLGDAPAVAVSTVMSVLGQTVSMSMSNAMAVQLGFTALDTAITAAAAIKIMTTAA